MLRVRAWLTRLWRTDRPLTAVALAMTGALAASLFGLWLDPRTIDGAPAWLKPAKFGASTAIYSLTLAWMFQYLPAWRRTRRTVGWITAVVFVVEVAIIDLQAWRGTTSHFNVSTPLDGALFGIMGLAIGLQTLASVGVAVALWRETTMDRALIWALRMGMVLTIAGAAIGGLMVRPTPTQLEMARTTQSMPRAGARTVGGPDGGPGLPGTGWSRDHGDLRVPHFVGLHAMQALGFLAWILPRTWSDTRRVRVVLVAAGGYAALLLILLGQALGGESIGAPGSATLIALVAWASGTAMALWLATPGLPGRPRDAAVT
jgi:hypothetical protein